MKIIISEEEKKRILGLYEQQTYDQFNQRSGCTGNPNSIVMIPINLFITRSLIDKNNTWINSTLSEVLENYASSYKVGFDFSTDVPTTSTQRQLEFQIQPTYKNALKPTGWLNKFFDGFTKELKETLVNQLKLDERYFKMVGPKYIWGDYFETEKNNCPDLCIGVSYRVDYNPPPPISEWFFIYTLC